MIVEEKPLNVEKSEDFEETEFTIEASAEAFRILSDGLYSNKIKAVIRELSTNAADAHIEAGHSQPFRVHLPNQFEPYLTIRDFGTGLELNALKKIYTGYFKSTKRNSNEVTGCLGLGSKSPFAYTDNFTVIDYYKGIKHTYTCYMGEQRVPKLALLSTEETTEPNGLEITIAVSPKDFSTFKEEAQEVYQYFKVRPVITGQTVTFEDDREPIFSGSNWRVYKGGSKHILTMGNVAYPINAYNAEINNNIWSYYSLEIEAPIGEVKMTASREALEYTSKTVGLIQKAANEAISGFAAQMQAEVDKCSTFFEACKFYSENSLFMAGAKWQGKTLVSQIHLNQYIKYHRLDKQYSDKIKTRLNKEFSRLDVSHLPLFVDNDAPRGATQRLKAYMIANKIEQAYLINWQPAEKQKFEDTVGELPTGMMIKSSDLPKAPKSASQKKYGPTPQVYTFETGAEKPSHAWNKDEQEEIELADGGIYVVLDHWTAEGYENLEILNSTIRSLKNLGHPVELVGFRKKLAEKVGKLSNWKTLQEYVEEVVVDNVKDHEYATNRHRYTAQDKLIKLETMLASDDLKMVVNDIKYAKKNSVRLDALANLIHRTKVQVAEVDVQGMVDELRKKYKLLFYIVDQLYTLDGLPKDAVREYLRLVDAENQKNSVDLDYVL